LSRIFEDRDHADWHGGIEEYGFWCVRIQDDVWLRGIRAIQGALGKDLLAGYSRFPHVTIHALGLMDERRWGLFQQQLAALTNAVLDPLVVSCSQLSSYDHCPILRVSCGGESMVRIRHLLHAVTRGDDMDAFDPHVTLGYYANVLDIAAVLRPLSLDPFPDHYVEEILFCTYRTNSIKGPLRVLDAVSLTR
jgi:2'-5' RNA ligase